MTSDPNVSALLDEMSRLQAGETGPTQEPLPLRRILGMQVGSELYGIDIEHINEIIKLPPITFVPGAPPYILGVTSLRGQIVPIINMRLILGVDSTRAEHPGPPAAGTQSKPRIVVVHHMDVFLGLLVDSVSEVYDLRARVEAPLGGLTRGPQIKEGHLLLGDRMLILLRVAALVNQVTES